MDIRGFFTLCIRLVIRDFVTRNFKTSLAIFIRTVVGYFHRDGFLADWWAALRTLGAHGGLPEFRRRQFDLRRFEKFLVGGFQFVAVRQQFAVLGMANQHLLQQFQLIFVQLAFRQFTGGIAAAADVFERSRQTPARARHF